MSDESATDPADDEPSPEGFDSIYDRIPESAVYRAIVARAQPDLPSWLVPFSAITFAELEWLARELAVDENAAFVDLCCGAGACSLWMAERTGAELTGVDWSKEAIAAARRLAERRDAKRATFAVAVATRTGLPSAAFDGLMSIDAIIFLAPHEAAREVARLLRPDGRVALTAWEFPEPHRETLVADYRPVFEAQGFRIVRHETYDSDAVEWRFFEAVIERATDLRAEIGASAEPVIGEAEAAIASKRDGTRRPRRRVLLSAVKAR